MNQLTHRFEYDMLGERKVPYAAYYGVQTLRATESLQATGAPLSSFPSFVTALATVKQAAAEANADIGLLSSARRDAIVVACTEIRDGRLHGHFVVDVVQGGAGFATNANANEVICNRALELMGHERGEYSHLHPNKHVDLSQSSSGVHSIALRIAAAFAAKELEEAMDGLAAAFLSKSLEFARVVKLGRDALQDETPITLGQEFETFRATLKSDRDHLLETCHQLRHILFDPTLFPAETEDATKFIAKATDTMNRVTGLNLKASTDTVGGRQDCGALVLVSGVLKHIAIRLSKISNDLRLLSSGPRSGFGEINLPPTQSALAITPGKIYPAVPEFANQVAFEVIGNDVTISLAAEAGQLQTNAFEPAITKAILRSFSSLTAACNALSAKCIKGITANPDRLLQSIEQSTALAAMLVPYLGFKVSADVASEAHIGNLSVREIILKRALMTEEAFDELLKFDRVVEMTIASQKARGAE